MKAFWLQLYFVLASLLGLFLIAVGSVILINTTLAQTVFKVESQNYRPVPVQPYISPEAIESNTELSEGDKQSLRQWQADYEEWENSQGEYDFETEQRKRAFSMGIAMVVAGTPLFALHAPVLFKKMAML